MTSSGSRSMRAAMISWIVSGSVTSAPEQCCLSGLDLDPARLPELAKDLLDVEGVPSPRSTRMSNNGADTRSAPSRAWLIRLTPSASRPPQPSSRKRRGEPRHLVVGAARQEKQQPVPRKLGRQVFEKLLRARVDPVHILDHQDGRLGVGRAKQDGPYRVEGTLLSWGPEKRRRNDSAPRRRGSGRPGWPVPRPRYRAPQAAWRQRTYLVAGQPLGEPHVPPQELQDRVVRDRGAVGQAGRFQLEKTRLFQTLKELEQQTGLADARVAGQEGDGAVAGAGSAICLGKAPNLALSSDQGRQATVLGDFQSAVPPDLGDHGVDAGHFGFTLELKLALVVEGEEPLGDAVGRGTDQDLPGTGEPPGGARRGLWCRRRPCSPSGGPYQWRPRTRSRC